MEYIEPFGVHSGDSNATRPPFNLGEFVLQQIKAHTQFAIKDDTVARRKMYLSK